MSARQTPSVDGIHMLGGEMLTWSDRQTRAGAFRGALGPVLVDRLPAGGRLLLVGPHDSGLVRALARRAGEMHVLERSWPDAQALRDELAGTPATVFCGPVQRFLDRGDQYDVVVALDGLDRLEGTDLAPLHWREILSGLAHLLTPAGRLVLGVPNPLALSRLVAPVAQEADGDAAWPLPPAVEATPPGLHALVEACGKAGLSVGSTFASFPDPHAPTLLVGADVFQECRDDARLAALVDDALRSAPMSFVPLKDPRALTLAAVKAGVAAELAAGWLIECGPGSDPAPGTVLVGEAARSDGLALSYALDASGPGAWERRPLSGVSAPADGGVARDQDRLAAPLPPGSVLEQDLLAAAAASDLTRMRQLVRGWADWLRGDPGLEPARLAFATPDNVIGTDDGFELADPSWRLDVHPSLDAVIVGGLTGFARRLRDAQVLGAWTIGTSEKRIVTTLAAATGLEIENDDALRQEGARLAVLTQRAGHDVTATDSGTDTGTAGPRRIVSLDDAAADLARLATEVAERDDQIEWLIGRIHRRELALRQRKRANAALRKSPEYLLGSKLLAARGRLRSLRRKAAEEKHLWRAPDPSEQAEPAKERPRMPELLPPGYRPPENTPEGGSATGGGTDRDTPRD